MGSTSVHEKGNQGTTTALRDRLCVDVVQRSVVLVVMRVSFGMSSAVVMGFILFLSFSSVVVINGHSGC